jgi:plasmid stabilization system protein ParE
MRVVYTTEALADLDGIFDYIANHYPAISGAFENRLHGVIARIARWPESAQEVSDRPGVRRTARPISIQGLQPNIGR